MGLGLVNAVISAGQEIRAKRKLDRLQLLERVPVPVLRDGREVDVAPDGVVAGDVVRVRSGDQIVVDGRCWTIGAQTGLSTFFCLASFVLILFLAPPTRFFAAWTRPIQDRRPAILVVVLIAVFGAVLFTSALSDYSDSPGRDPPSSSP